MYPFSSNSSPFQASAAAAAASRQSCPTLCDPIDSSPPGSLIPGILQAGTLATLGCRFLLQCMKVKSESEIAQSCPTLCNPHRLQPTRLLHPWDFPGKSTGVGRQCLLLQVIIIFNNHYSSCKNLLHMSESLVSVGSVILVPKGEKLSLGDITMKQKFHILFSSCH